MAQAINGTAATKSWNRLAGQFNIEVGQAIQPESFCEHRRRVFGSVSILWTGGRVMLVTRIFAVLATFMVSTVVLALVANETSEQDARKVVLRPQTQAVDKSIKGVGDDTVVKRDQLSGAARLITLAPQHRSDPVGNRTQQDFERDMLSYVQDNFRLLGAEPRDLRLMPEATLITDELAFFKYNVFRDDIPVEDASILFRFKFGSLVQVVNYSFAEAQPMHAAASLSDRELREILRRELGENDYVALGSSWRVTVRDSAYRLLKVRHFRQRFGRQAIIQINAHTGKIYEVTPQRYYFSSTGYARATLYPRWYRQDLNLMPLRGVGIDFLDHAGQVVQRVASDHEGFFLVPQQGLTPQLNGVIGAQISVSNQSGPAVNVNGVFNDETWHTFIGRQLEAEVSNDKLVAQSMVYYHLQHIVRTASDYISSSWFNRPLKANTNLTRTCNAHWDTLLGTVNFYSGDRGCANTGLIADVIYHEWGHGLDANSGGIVDPAFSEGFGDIVSMLMTRSHVIGPDFALNGKPVRDLEPDRVYPRDVSNSVHSTGLIIGSTFWNLFTAFKEKHTEERALEILRRYAFQMIFTAERYTDVYDALLVIDDNDADLSNGTPNLCMLNEIFNRHGLASRDGECQLAEFTETRSHEQRGNGNRVIEPGETIEVNAWLKNTTARDFVNLQARASSASEYLQWHNDVATWQQLASGNTMRSDTPLSFTVSEDTPCGESFKIDLELDIENQLRSISTVLQVGSPSGRPDLFKGVGLPREIPDSSAVEVRVSAQGQQWQETTTVAAAQLKFSLFHFAHQQIKAELVTPEGKAVEVFNGKLGLGILAIERDVSDLLQGHRGQGEWRLRVIDKQRGIVGYLLDFSLSLTPDVFTCQR